MIKKVRNIFFINNLVIFVLLTSGDCGCGAVPPANTTDVLSVTNSALISTD